MLSHNSSKMLRDSLFEQWRLRRPSATSSFIADSFHQPRWAPQRRLASVFHVESYATGGYVAMSERTVCEASPQSKDIDAKPETKVSIRCSIVREV
jgi:hypothetical protein